MHSGKVLTTLNTKIGILTFHWSTNYGAILQAYCLQEYLREQKWR